MRHQKNEKLESRGPWLFENPEQLSPGEAWKVDFRERQYNGRKRYFKPHLPLDTSQITNRSSSEPIKATYNGRFETYVVPNAVETFSDQGITFVRVVNDGANNIAAGEVVLEVAKDAYDADDEARKEAKRGQIANVVENFTGIQL